MKITLALLMAFFSIVAFSGTCEVITDRKACSGKEKEMLKPYSGQNPTTDLVKKDKDGKDMTLEGCKKHLEAHYKIVRGGVLGSKKTTGKFDGKEIFSKSDSKEKDCK